MRLLLKVILTFFLFTFPVFGQSEKPQTIIVPPGSLGEISETRIKILEKTLESKLGEYFEIVPKQLFEEAQEKAFEELDYEECTEDQCIMMIQEMLQVENAFQLILIHEDGDTQLSVTWTDLDQKRVKEEYCEGCKTKELRKTISRLIEMLIVLKKDDLYNNEEQKKVEPFVQKIEKNKSNGLFVGVGDSGIILTSSNGTIWTQRSSGTTNRLYGVTYGKGVFVTVGMYGTILTSQNGSSWENNSSKKFGHINQVIFGNDIFVAVGEWGNVLTSFDGENWTKINSNFSKYLGGVTYGNRLFLSVGYSGTIHSSIDGSSWAKRTTGTRDLLQGVTHGKDNFITVSSRGNIFSSSDGISWIKRTSGTTTFLNAVNYGNDNFITVGLNGLILTSIDGISWVKRDTGISSNLFGITSGKGIMVAIGESGTILTSSDSKTWILRESHYKNLYGINFSK